jgi:site-specific DNA-cytosine methylase
MKILVACEESQVVTIALRELGHEAYSCDLLEPSGGHPEWHLQQDVTELIQQNWDAVIAFPPCIDLAVSGARHFAAKRADGRQQRSIEFFMQFTRLDHVPIVIIENPIGIMSSHYKKPDQIIQPYEHGHPEQKSTCLWLKGVPLLKPSNNVKEEMMNLPRNQRERIHFLPPSKDRSKLRSKTFDGIAKAIANQWFSK